MRAMIAGVVIGTMLGGAGATFAQRPSPWHRIFTEEQRRHSDAVQRQNTLDWIEDDLHQRPPC